MEVAATEVAPLVGDPSVARPRALTTASEVALLGSRHESMTLPPFAADFAHPASIRHWRLSGPTSLHRAPCPPCGLASLRRAPYPGRPSLTSTSSFVLCCAASIGRGQRRGTMEWRWKKLDKRDLHGSKVWNGGFSWATGLRLGRVVRKS